MCYFRCWIVCIYPTSLPPTGCDKSSIFKWSTANLNSFYSPSYAEYQTLLANAPAQAESLLHSPELVAGDISLCMNANKTEYMCFKQKGTISTSSGKPLKSVDQYTYFSSNISSTENDVNVGLVKLWSAIDRLLIIWKSDLFNEIKQDFCNCAIWWTLMKCIKKNIDEKYTRMLHAVFTNPESNIPQNCCCTATCFPSQYTFK